MLSARVTLGEKNEYPTRIRAETTVHQARLVAAKRDNFMGWACCD